MKQKLNCILLIDDDEATNFINERVLRKSNCTDRIVVKQGAQAALDYLKSKNDGEHPKPDLIFLDINMPAINGWEFLEAYKKLDDDQKGKIIIVMLTNSFNPDDQIRAKNIEEVNDFKNKPLTTELVQEILNTYFADRL